MIKKTATQKSRCFFDKYQVISEMQENKSASKIITIIKICIPVPWNGQRFVCDKTLMHHEQ